MQAASGLMAVHGQERGRPERLGLEVASVVAGVLAVQGVLAGLIGQARGLPITAVNISALEAALVVLTHNFSVETNGVDWRPAPPVAGWSAPPFLTADGYLVEIECLDPEAWKTFWETLALPPRCVGDGWRRFLYRYATASCQLAPEFADAVRSQAFADFTAAAQRHGIVGCRVRDYSQPPVPIFPSLALSARPGSSETHRATQAPGQPLSGIRVLDLTSRTQGPLAALQLVMLGAEVVRIEPPGGDPARGMPPLAGDTGAVFAALNRGKSSVQVDLKSRAGRDTVRELARDADVFIHNWRPGRAEAFGLDEADLHAVNSRLVYAAASGWGRSTPHDLPPIATDYLVQAQSGVAAGLTPTGEPPVPSRVIVIDVLGGLLACEGVLAALLLRERTGSGCRTDTSMWAAAGELQAHVAEGLATGNEKGRRQGRPVWTHCDRPLPTADDLLAVTLESDAAFHRFAEVVGSDGWRSRISTEDDAGQRLLDRPAVEWERLLVDAGIPCAVVAAELAGIPHDPRLAALFEPLDGSRVPGRPWRFHP